MSKRIHSSKKTMTAFLNRAIVAMKLQQFTMAYGGLLLAIDYAPKAYQPKLAEYSNIILSEAVSRMADNLPPFAV